MIHIYCGDGKGKTTAAVGLAVRCAGAGGTVLFYQFMNRKHLANALPYSKSMALRYSLAIRFINFLFG